MFLKPLDIKLILWYNTCIERRNKMVAKVNEVRLDIDYGTPIFEIIDELEKLQDKFPNYKVSMGTDIVFTSPDNIEDEKW